MLFPRTTSIGVRVTCALVLGVTALMAAAGLYSYRAIQRRLHADLRDQQVRRVEELAIALRLPAWNLDLAQVDRILDATMLAPYAERATVRLDVREGTLRERRREPAPAASLPAEVRPILYEQARLGTVEFAATTAPLEPVLRELRRAMIAFGLVVDALLVGGLFVLLRRSVLWPLREIERFARDGERSGAPPSDLASRLYRGELESLRASLLAMIGQLRANETRLRLIGDNLPDSMVYQVAREAGGGLRYVHVSAGVERIHGIRAPDLLADASLLTRQLLPEDLTRLNALADASVATLGVFQAEARIRRPDGQLRWISFCSQPRRLPDGQVVWDGIEMDITERKQAEQERIRLGRAIEAHDDAACWMDVTNRIVYANDAMLRSVGLARAELVGSELSRIAPHATTTRMETIWARLRRDGHYRAEGLHQRKDGTTFPVDVSATHVVIDGEEFMCAFARDISSRRATEQELQRQLEELRRWQSVTLNREGRIGQLKAEINTLCRQLGVEPRYAEPVGSPPEGKES